MKKIMIPFSVGLYLLVVCFFLAGCEIPELSWVSYLFIPLVIIELILAVTILIVGIKNADKEDKNTYQEAMIFKIINAPFIIGNFVISILVLLGSILSIFTIFWLASLPLLVIAILMWMFNYIVLLVTSVNPIIKLIKKRKDESIIFIIINIVFQFIYLADIIDNAYLNNYFNKNL